MKRPGGTLNAYHKVKEASLKRPNTIIPNSGKGKTRDSNQMSGYAE